MCDLPVSRPRLRLAAFLLAGLLPAGSGFGQILPTITAYASVGLTLEDAGTSTVVSLPAETSRSLTAVEAGASGTSSIVGDFHLRQAVSAASGASGNEARGYAQFNLAAFDTLAFTPSAAPRVVRLHWELQYLALLDSTYAVNAQGGSGTLEYALTGTARIRNGIFVRDIRQLSLGFSDHNNPDQAGTVPSATIGFFEFSLNEGETLQFGGVQLFSSAAAIGSAVNLVNNALTVNTWFRIETVTPGIDLLSTQSLFTTYSAQASAIPEPSTYAAAGGLAALGFACWRRRRNPMPDTARAGGSA